VDEKTTPLQQSPPKNPEASIPLFKQGEARKSETGQALNSLVLSLALILGSAMLLIGGARWYRGRTRTAQVQTRIQMLTQFHLGPKKSLALVQVAGETLLVGVTDHNITLIKALSLLDDEIPERIPKSFTDEVVREVESEIDRKVEARSRPVLSAATAGAEADDLVHNVKDMVTTRLRNMRSI
jgi:flagellar protein FliO/FliZ